MAQKKRVIDYDEKDESASTATHLSVDEKIDSDLKNPATPAYREGFAASSGIRPEAAESGGRIKNDQMKDDPRPDSVPDSIEKENSGLADS